MRYSLSRTNSKAALVDSTGSLRAEKRSRDYTTTSLGAVSPMDLEPLTLTDLGQIAED